MTHHIIIFAALALALGIFALLHVRALSFRMRVAVVAAYPVLLAGLAAGGSDVIGRPKPVWAELRNVETATIVASYWREGEAIWLWLTWPGQDEPVAYRLPWSVDTAERIVRATGDGGGGAEIDAPFGDDWLTLPGAIHPKPVEALPPKGGS